MRLIVSFCCVLVICSNAIANELVVGEQGSVAITLPNQPNNQKCNIEVKFADGSSQDVEVDPKNPTASVSFTPTIAGTQVIQWDGKMKWRGLKSRPPCEGDGNVSVNVRERAEVLAEREAEAERLRAEQAVETERLKLEAERLKAEREAKARLARNRQTLANLVSQLDTDEKKLCGFEYARTKSTNPQRYEGMDASQWTRKLNGSRIVSPNTINEVESAVNVCNQFFAKERRWGSQTFEPPTEEYSCTLKSGAESVCYWTYSIYANDAWQDSTAMQAMQAHITSGETYWSQRYAEKPDAKARREKREAELARERAQECKNNPLKYSTCPGYAAAKEEQEKREAEAEKQRQLAAARPLTKNTLRRGYTYRWNARNSCIEKGKFICVNNSNYEWLCKNYDGVSNGAFWVLASGITATPAERHIAKHGSTEELSARWDERYLYGCRTSWRGSGLYEGSFYRTNTSGATNEFIVNDQGKIIIGNATTWSQDANARK